MPLEKHNLDADQIFTVANFLSAEECCMYIALSEAIGFDEAPVTTVAGPVLRKDIRDNLRVLYDDAELSAHWFARIEPFMPEAIRARVPAGDTAMPAEQPAWNVRGLNERCRFYRYDVGHRFAMHLDGC